MKTSFSFFKDQIFFKKNFQKFSGFIEDLCLGEVYFYTFIQLR